MGYGITILLTFLSFAKKRSKEVNFLIVLWLIILFGLNFENRDYSQYLKEFNSIAAGTGHYMEIGYVLLMKLACSLRLNFITFHFLLLSSCVYLNYRLVKKFVKDCPWYFALFLLFPGWIFPSIIRNYVMLTILLLTIPYFIENKRGNLIKIIFFTIIAASIHIAALYWLIFLPAKFKKLSSTIWSTTLSFGFLWFLLSSNLIQNILIKFLLHFRKESSLSIQNFFKTYHGLGGATYPIVILLYISIFTMLVYYFYWRKAMVVSERHVSSQSIACAKLILKMNICNFILVFPCAFSWVLLRLVFNILPINYILYSLTSSRADLKGTKNIKIICLVFTVILLTIFLFYQSETIGMINGDLRPIFEKNFLFFRLNF